MWIELRETGGLPHLEQRLLVEDDRLTVSEGGVIRADRPVEAADRDALAALAAALEQAAPKPSYGRMLGGVPSRTTLSTERLTVSVRPDPAFDQPPDAFWKIVRVLHRLGDS